MVENFWIEGADNYSKEGFEINEMGTHPQLIRFFEKHCKSAVKVLDFGCGDGSLMFKINRDIDVSLYDISKQMLDLAKDKLKNINPSIYHDLNEIPENYFDCIFISMVFVCTSDEEGFLAIIKEVKKSIKKGGVILVANPHPCFRDKPFSSYFTEYTIGKNFNYFNNGEKHQIFLRHSSINFHDYNWSVSFMLNSFISNGFRLVEMLELEDNKTNEYYNKDNSPSIIYAFKIN